MRSFSTSSNRSSSSSSSSSSGGVIRNLLHRSYLRLSFKSLSLAILFACGVLDISQSISYKSILIYTSFDLFDRFKKV